MSAPILTVSNVSASYGPIRALRGLSFHIEERETVAIVGANGAGKTTLMRALSGILPISDGSASFLGHNIRKTPGHQLARLGMLHLPEGRGTLQTMTVEQNIRMAWEIRPSQIDFPAAAQKAYDRFPRLYERRSQLAGNLSGGEQQMLAIARSLVNRPKLLLLDEPSMGLSPRLTNEVFQSLAELRDDGVAMLVVEQNVSKALHLSHRALVLSHGHFTASGTSQQLLEDPTIVASYLGHATA